MVLGPRWDGRQLVADDRAVEHRRAAAATPGRHRAVGGTDGSVPRLLCSRRHPYWESKNADIAQITAPAYVVASYTNPIHVEGTFRGWNELTSPRWLRIHNTNEWPDFYEPRSVEDLRRFFDRYLHGLDNGWETTPQVRMAILDPGHDDVVDRPADHFPPADAARTDLFLHTEGLSSAATVGGLITVTTTDPADFTFTFDRDTEVVGSPVVTLHASVDGHDDADLFVQIQKLDRRGRPVWHQITDLGLPFGRRWMPVAFRFGVRQLAALFYPGPNGQLRLSRRGIGRRGLDLTQDNRLATGEIVEATIPLLPTAMRFHAGERLRLRVAMRPLTEPPSPACRVRNRFPHNELRCT